MRRNAMFAVTTMSLVSLGLVLAATDAANELVFDGSIFAGLLMIRRTSADVSD